MKIAITSKGQTLESDVDPRFGRAAYIIIVDTKTRDFEVIDNSENKNAFKGAGIKAATAINDKQAKVLITGYCGPNAFTALSAADIKIVNDAKGIVNEMIDKFCKGDITYAESANKEGQW